MMSSGFLGPEAAANASSRLEAALEEMKAREDRKIAEAEAKAAAEAAAAAEENSDDEFLNDPDLDRLREARLAQLKAQQDSRKVHLALGHGEYREITEEEFLPQVTTSKFVIVHFYHRDYERCKIIDKHLRILCQKYVGTKFVYLNAEKAPFFVGKLKIRTLPTLVLFEDGIMKAQQIGFDGLGDDTFPTRRLEKRLAEAGVLRLHDGTEAEMSSDDEDDDDERRDGATYAEYMAAKQSKLRSAHFEDEDD